MTGSTNRSPVMEQQKCAGGSARFALRKLYSALPSTPTTCSARSGGITARRPAGQ